MEKSLQQKTLEKLAADNLELKAKIIDLETSIMVLSKIEDALRMKESRLLDFLENTHDLIQIVDSDGRFQYVNRQWMTTLGYSVNDFVSLNLMDVIHPDYLEHCSDIFEEVMKGGSAVCAETALIAKDGRKVFVEGSVSCRFEEGKAVSHRAIFHDITRRKQDQEEREALIADLQKALNEINTLGRLLPICFVCKNIRDDSGYWQQVETYLNEHIKTEFTHSICPDCLAKALKDLDNDETKINQP